MTVVYRQTIERDMNAKLVPTQTNRIYVVDCSGSMYSVMPKMKEQIKNKIPQLTNIGDTVSIVWFSSKGESGVLLKGIEVDSIMDFKMINSAIDRWLQPLSLTGYVDPLKHVNNIIEELSEQYPGGAFSTLFFTDGSENQSSREAIINAVKNTKSDSFTIVEFGWCCDRDLLNEMAEACGGSVVFSESFGDYEDTFEAFMTKPAVPGKRKTVVLDYPAPLGYAFYAGDGEILTFMVEDKKVSVPEYVTRISYIADTHFMQEPDDIYAAIYTTAQKALGNETWALLKKTGDVKLVKEFTNCFSKQDYSAFQESVKAAVFDKNMRGLEGIDFNCVPADDAYTVLDLLEELCKEGNLFHPYDPEFSYSRTSAKKAQKGSKEEKEDLLKKLQNADNEEDYAKAHEKLAGMAVVAQTYKFVPSGDNPGYRVEATYSASRPNISLRFTAYGTVNIGPSIYGLPEEFPTRVTRNYSVVRDGIKHSSLECLPFSLTKKSYEKLVQEGVLEKSRYKAGKVYYINAKSLPVVNRKSFTEVSAVEFFGACVERLHLQAEQKVYNTFMKQDFPYVSEEFVEKYSAEAERFLADIGITEKNGFSPRTVSTEPTDKYIAKEVNVKIDKCSSLPTINEKLLNKISSGKSLTLTEALMAPHIKVVQAFKDNKLLSSDTDSYKVWLEEKRSRTACLIRKQTLEISKYIFVLTLGKVWFKEFNSMNENSMGIQRDGNEFKCTIDIKNVEIKL